MRPFLISLALVVASGCKGSSPRPNSDAVFTIAPLPGGEIMPEGWTKKPIAAVEDQEVDHYFVGPAQGDWIIAFGFTSVHPTPPPVDKALARTLQQLAFRALRFAGEGTKYGAVVTVLREPSLSTGTAAESAEASFTVEGSPLHVYVALVRSGLRYVFVMEGANGEVHSDDARELARRVRFVASK